MNIQYPKQLSNESNANYSLFKWYCNSGTKRSIKNFSLESNKSERSLYEISKQNNWTERTKQFDQIQKEKDYIETNQEQKNFNNDFINNLNKIQQQLNDFISQVSNLKPEEIINDEDNHEEKLNKVEKILKIYHKYINITLNIESKINHFLANPLNSVNFARNEINQINMDSQKLKNSLQIPANIAKI